jgi:hypothetical protein
MLDLVQVPPARQPVPRPPALAVLRQMRVEMCIRHISIGTDATCSSTQRTRPHHRLANILDRYRVTFADAIKDGLQLMSNASAVVDRRPFCPFWHHTRSERATPEHARHKTGIFGVAAIRRAKAHLYCMAWSNGD